MGRTINTNIEQTMMGNQHYDQIVMKSLIKTYPVVMFDNIPGKSYFPIFDNFFVDEKEGVPLYISKSWQMGGGPGSPDYINYFLNPNSSLYLPSMIINGLIGSASYDLAKKIFAYLKKKFPQKRFSAIFLSKKEEVTYYEFPSETTETDFNNGIDEIPQIAEKAEPQTIFVRSLRDNGWKKEDNS
jgi:hypothetical protein